MDKTEWNIKVRVVRCYERTTFGDRSTVLGLEVILHDSEGYCIHASITKFDMEIFRCHLKEGSVIAIWDSIVAPNGDVIGRVVGINKPQTRTFDNRTTRFAEITLEDVDRNKLSCTLWKEKVDEIVPSILNRDIGPLVVILQFFRAKVVGASVKVSNTFDITKLIFDQSADEIKEFVAAYGGCAEIAGSIREVNAPLVITDNVETENISVKTIDYLYKCGQVGSYWICALIESLTGDYWYQSCCKCPKKLTSTGKKFYCEKCDDFFDDGVLK
ncbi:replication protein A 70 kDa DNA-binding subunit [Striga asiatica]|uniref:Replication protein A 70 kDa DNA-binding subunit n=1 Tax=Striga asiatica TaxID=4170 RepID=A0A5A7PYS8_STRAF|nr:replication protein A 70 kDa DNA-binding subunit [Striga asiatica]